jgi:hypothetical protein
MMLTVRQLLKQTGQGHFGRNGMKTAGTKIIQNSNEVSVSFNRPKAGKDARGYYRSLTCSARTNKPGKKTKRMEIRFYWPKGRSKDDQYIPPEFIKPGDAYWGPKEPPKFDLDTPCWVSCSCEWFLFVCEVADAESDNATIRYSNGKFPVETNPRGIGTLCKHLISAIRKGALLKK